MSLMPYRLISLFQNKTSFSTENLVSEHLKQKRFSQLRLDYPLMDNRFMKTVALARDEIC